MNRLILLVLCLLLLLACGHSEIRDQKISKYHPEVQNVVRNGKLMHGMDFEMVSLSIGETPCKCYFFYKEMYYEIWGYNWDARKQKPAWGGDCMKTPVNVYFENGQVVGWDNWDNLKH